MRNKHIVTVMLAALILMLPHVISAGPADLANNDQQPFFLMGDGRIHIRNEQSGIEADVTLLNADGSLSEKAFKKIDAVFGFPADKLGGHVSARLIFMLDYFSDIAAPGRVINLLSGYRSPAYNTKLKKGGGNVARTSTHLDGMALDFYIEGVDGKELWQMIRQRDCCGIGHYGGMSVHLDSARPRFWEAATSKVHTRESDYNRRIYLSTEFDRYRAGDKVRLFLSSVSDFGFGISRRVNLVKDAQGDSPAVSTEIMLRGSSDCLMINNRKAARSILVPVPGSLPQGQYRFQIEYCRRLFEQMPEKSLSNVIQVFHSSK